MLHPWNVMELIELSIVLGRVVLASLRSPFGIMAVMLMTRLVLIGVLAFDDSIVHGWPGVIGRTFAWLGTDDGLLLFGGVTIATLLVIGVSLLIWPHEHLGI